MKVMIFVRGSCSVLSNILVLGQAMWKKDIINYSDTHFKKEARGKISNNSSFFTA